MSTGLKANVDGSAAIQVGGTDVITLTSGGAATFVTSPTTVQAGTAAAPSITTSGDTNTGIFFPAADTIAFAEGGAEVARFDSAGNLLVGRTTTSLNNSTGTLIQPLTTTIASNSNGTLRLGNYSPTVSADIGGLLRFDAVYRNSDGDSTDIASIAGLRENATNSNYAGYLSFSTTPNGGSRTERARITSGGDVVVTSDGGALGYGSGSGGTVTQATSKTTTVTLNKPSGTVTMNNAALANGASVSFAVFNNKVAQTDTIVVNMVDDIGSTYTTTVWGVWDGYFNIRITNNSGVSLSEAVRINFTVINGSRA